jgi:hypothetical protein
MASGLRFTCVQDEEQEAQEAPPVRDVVGEQLAGGIGRDGWFADDRYPEASGGEGVGHRMKRPGPETQQSGLASRGPLCGVAVGREIVGLETDLTVPQVLYKGWSTDTMSRPPGLSTRRSSASAGPQSCR